MQMETKHSRPPLRLVTQLLPPFTRGWIKEELDVTLDEQQGLWREHLDIKLYERTLDEQQGL